MSKALYFSRRTSWDLAETDLTKATRERRAAGLPIFDLTASNPTRCGFHYDEAYILAALAQSQALTYDPNPRGMLPAREAVGCYYADHGADAHPDRIFLTPSTSEAYSYLFRVLCDPGDEILIAQPSYPLFDFLAQIESVRLVPYPLFYDHGWHLDAEALRRQITPRTRAIALVHPNNPTGHFLKPAERRELETICEQHGLALIVDEVFLDYWLGDTPPASFACGPHPVLTFVLSGLSKIAALPQMKAAWIAAFGPPPALTPALDRIEVVADTFLSMNAPVQCALPIWLQIRDKIQRQVLTRLHRNLVALDLELAGSPVTQLEVEGGWYAVLRIPAIDQDEDVAVRLVREFGVVVHPGHFFGFPDSGWLVLSLLSDPSDATVGYESISTVFK
ncbi:MAG TPA: pyridoxal phosphate-dependent aminotransferase [Acidobacteriaceae bacterium]|nr:pyridoxal phosphate-dependent aminotransferase [Acidobacteriaceae bacterium]